MSDPLIGKVLGDYTIVELLGRGGMARVYRGYDGKLNRYAAVKVIDTEIENEELREEFQARFVREARAIARLQHPNIVGVYQFDQLWDLNFMAMQFVEGEDLRYILEDLHNRSQLLPQEKILTIMRDIASALDYAHSQGVIHRDVKPSNIMVTPDGHGVLTDFGLVLNVEDGTVGNTFGSAHYIAPEQAVSSAQSVPESDLYSLGVVLYEMATGKVPFDDPSTMSVALKHLNEPPPLPSTINPNIEPELEDVILHMLRKTPADRYASGAEFVAALTDSISPALPDEDDTEELPVTRSDPRRSRSRGKARQTLPLPDRAAGPGAAAPVIGTPRGKPETDTYVPPASAGGGRRGLWILLALVLVAALIGGLALSGQLPGLGLGETSTPEAAAGLPTGTSPETAATITKAPAAATARTTSLPTDAPPTSAPLQPTSTPLPTETPLPTSTPPPTAVPPSAVPAGSEGGNASGDILLVYDGDSLLLVNQAAYTIDVDPLLLQAVDPESGQVLDFAVSDLRGGATPTDALPPGTCFHIWRMDLNAGPATMPYDAACATRAAWRAVSRPHWFWISGAPGAAFDVSLFGQVIATCPIAAGRCVFSIPS